MKWTTQAGPKQTKAVSKAINDFDWESKTYQEVYGTKGVDEHTSTLTQMFGGAREDAAPLMVAIYEKHQGLITRENYGLIERDIRAAIETLKASRPVKDARRDPEEVAETNALCAEREAVRDAAAAVKKVVTDAVLAKKPAGAAALIVAIETVDDSDMMTDYHGEHTTKTVAIGWRFSSREDFKALRAAAGAYEPTAHLGVGKGDYFVRAVWMGDTEHQAGQAAPCGYELDTVHYTTRAEAEAAVAASVEEMTLSFEGGKGTVEYRIEENQIEHRENYSMGKGNYLQSRRSGWRVKSVDVAYVSGLDEDALPTAKVYESAVSDSPVSESGGATITENVAKAGIEIRFPAKPASEVLDRLKANGWRWSRFSSCWYHKADDRARAFAKEVSA